MVEALSSSYKQLTPAERADEQLDFIKAMLEFDGKTQLDAKFFAPKGSHYTASFSDRKAIRFTHAGTDGSEVTKHRTIRPFAFDELEVIHIAPHEAKVKLRDPLGDRVAAFTLRQVVSIDQLGEPVTISGADRLKLEVVDPETITA